MKWILFFSAIICFLSCTENKKDIYAVGKYVYLDTYNRLHINKNCWRIGDEVEFIDTTLLYSKDEYKYCNDCFTDSTYEHVQSIMQNDINRKWLYEKFKDANYEMPSYSQFIQEIANVQKRKKAYQHATEENFNVGTFEDFSNMLGF
jgi:hypothetical protein|uniref:Uncharacterized protein n=1 Tax=Podoviridae sp. ctn7K25 TaxID=2825273 RepID=A0A8S5QCB0_9CAUD|nr:MAG TPA: hypothetical protein [Podoviridae sp. ctn7K25]